MKLLHLRVTCPACGAPPALRIYPSEVERYRVAPPDQPVQSYQCMRRLRGGRPCGKVYDIPASAFQHAFPAAA